MDLQNIFEIICQLGRNIYVYFWNLCFPIHDFTLWHQKANTGGFFDTENDNQKPIIKKN